jgi:GTPase SAR1 family protein
MIIVEGPDGAGKTTLVNRIMEEEQASGLQLMPRAVSKQAQSLTQIDDYIEEELAKGFGLRLYDRFALLSSPCYAMLPNRTFAGRMFEAEWLRAQYHRFLTIDPVIIVCLPSLTTVRRNTHTGDDNLVVQKDIETIYINYLTYLASQVNNTSVMQWDYENPNEVRLGNLITWAKGRVDFEQHGEERRHKRWKTNSD